VSRWHLIDASAAAVPFGDIPSGIVLDGPPVVDAPPDRVDDAPLPRRDGVVFGVDFLDGFAVTFPLAIAGADEAEVRSRAGTFAAAWRAEAIRRTPGAVAQLQSPTGRVLFGRPRHLTPDDTDAPSGLILATALFAGADARWYGPEQSVAAPFTVMPSGGMVAPFVAPFTTASSAAGGTTATVGGLLDTSPIVTINGPVTNADVTIGPLRFVIRASLAADESVVIDTRPWRSTITRNGAPAPGILSADSTWLADALLPPGDHLVAIQGTSESGTASVSVAWRDAFPTY
jgi:hypothetical protein